jgi:tetratricopeptide (TPR) repeat protein
MAELHRQQGDFQKAVECMEHMAVAEPTGAQEKVFLLADCLLKVGRAREAVDALEAAGQRTPLPGWAQVLLGQGYYQLKDYERAAEHYRQAVDDPQQASVARYGLSLALTRLGRADEAQKQRAEYVRVQEQNMVAFDRMQHAGTDQERQDPTAWYPVLARFHFEAGRRYALAGQAEAARRHCLRAWALAPERSEPRQLLEALEQREASAQD